MTYANELRETRPYLWIWHARRLSLDALTGQPGTLVRGVASTASRDSFGANGLSVARDRPPWTCLGTQGGLPGLWANTNTLLHWGDWRLSPTAMSGVIEFVERGPTNSGGILWIGNDGATGAWLSVDANSVGQYRIRHNNGSTSVNAGIAAAPSAGQVVRLHWVLYVTGAVQLWQSINGAAEVASSVSSTAALASTWGSGAKLRLNSIGAANQSAVEYRGGVIAPGDLPLERLLEALNP